MAWRDTAVIAVGGERPGEPPPWKGSEWVIRRTVAVCRETGWVARVAAIAVAVEMEVWGWKSHHHPLLCVRKVGRWPGELPLPLPPLLLWDGSRQIAGKAAAVAVGGGKQAGNLAAIAR